MGRLLILGGTGEAATLACLVAKTLPEVEIVTSLAGRTLAPPALPGTVRIGGFGGAEGLAAFLRAEGITAMIDATHPFAARISAHAAAAAEATAVPLLALRRPGWVAAEGDRWVMADSMADAARRLPSLGRRAFLSVGRQEIGAFAGLTGIRFLVRLLAPEELPLADYRVVLGRGPFRVADEIELLREHDIDVVVSKDSGGAATFAKIKAARALALPVLMMRRPALPQVECVADVEAAVTWLTRLCRPG